METNVETTPNKKTQPLTSTAGNSENEIREVIKKIMAAMHTANVDLLMSFYASDVVAFDVMTPIQFIGKEAYKKSWIEAFAGVSDSKEARQDIHELKITAGTDVAFAHLIRHDVYVAKDGKKMEMWMRATHCFQKIDGKWLITHEQFSFPVDLKTNQAVVDAQPETSMH